MKSNPLVSFIIPTYNRAHLIGETLDSVLAQTYENWECIVVDDGSIDNTAEVLNRYINKDHRFQYYQRPKEKIKGPNSCRNYGFDKSKGELIQFFDSDDVMKSNFLEIKRSCFKDLIDVVICKLSFYDFEKKIELKQNKIISKNLLYDYFCGKVALYVSGPIWRRNFLESKSLLFDETIINCDDWDFNMRMLYHEPQCKFINESLMLYRIHPESLSSGVLNNNFIEVKNVSDLLHKHLYLLPKKEKIFLKKYYQYAIRFNKYYLRESIINRDKIQFFLAIRIFKYSLRFGFFADIFKILFGKISFILFRRGSIFFK